MKSIVMTLTIAAILSPLSSFAKVSDFNAMISDNMKAQADLHSSIKGHIATEKNEITEPRAKEKIVLVDTKKNSYNVPTSKKLLTFEKEKRQHNPSDKLQVKRIANEVNASDF